LNRRLHRRTVGAVQRFIDKAEVLVEALPYLSRFRGKTIVVKYGGRALDDPALRPSFCRDVVLLKYVGIHPVIVHGGGPQIEEVLARMKIPSRKVRGMRITDEQTMEVVEMVLGAKVNKELVRLIARAGGKAVGVTGKDGPLVRARRLQRINAAPPGQLPEWVDPGLVGEITSVDATLLERLIHDGFIPVIAPVASDEELGVTLNINADPFAASVAAALGAEKLVLLTDVQGVRDAAGELIPSLSYEAAEDLIARGVIDGGMIPKVGFGLSALAAGVRKVHVIDGRLSHAVLLEIFTDTGIGTELTGSGEGEPFHDDITGVGRSGPEDPTSVHGADAGGKVVSPLRHEDDTGEQFIEEITPLGEANGSRSEK
jgi:acetylglutamate kinase